MFNELNNFINKIYDIKSNGDFYSHPMINMAELFNLIEGWYNVKMLLKQLDLDKLLKNFNIIKSNKKKIVKN